MEYGHSSTKLHLKINVRFSKTLKVEIIPANSKRNNRCQKYASFRYCIRKKILFQYPPVSFITHTMHYIHHKSLILVLILSRTALHATDQVLWQDLASHVISPPTNLFSLEQPCDAARSRPIRPKNKKFVSIPWTKCAFRCSYFCFLFIFCGTGCLSQGKEGQREK